MDKKLVRFIFTIVVAVAMLIAPISGPASAEVIPDPVTTVCDLSPEVCEDHEFTFCFGNTCHMIVCSVKAFRCGYATYDIDI